MPKGIVAALSLAAQLVAAGCRLGGDRNTVKLDSTDLDGRAARVELAIRGGDSMTARDEPIARWVLPADLNEASGLALTSDGRLLTHGDEQGVVSEIDYRRGVVVKRFVLGRRAVLADFEGIAIAGDSIFLLTSNGKLYEFKEGANGEHVEYRIHDTELGRECEFEGLAYDAEINSLLLACKNVGTKKLRNSLVIYRWKLDGENQDRLSHLAVPLESVLAAHDWKDFHPTGIEVDPTGQTYILVAAIERALIVISPDGKVLSTRELPTGHDQPEGVTITKDSILIISDEAVQRPAVITLYRWP